MLKAGRQHQARAVVAASNAALISPYIFCMQNLFFRCSEIAEKNLPPVSEPA